MGGGGGVRTGRQGRVHHEGTKKKGHEGHEEETKKVGLHLDQLHDGRNKALGAKAARPERLI